MRIDDKQFSASDWIFKAIQGVAMFLILQFYYTSQQQTKEIQTVLYELKEEKAVQKQLNGFLIDAQENLKKENETMKQDIRNLEQRLNAAK